MKESLARIALFVGTIIYCSIYLTPLANANNIESSGQSSENSKLSNQQGIATGDLLPTLKLEFDQALHFAEAEDWQKANDILKKLHKLWPDNKQITNNLAVSYFYLGRIDKAQNLFAEVLESSQETRTSFQNIQFLYGYATAEAYRQGLGIDKKIKLPEMILKRSLSQPWEDVPTKLAASASTREKNPINNLTKEVKAVSQATTVKESEQDINEVEECISKWAAAWSAGNCQDFLSFYRPDYAPHDLSRSAWIKDRQQKVRPEKDISVKLELKDISPDRKTGGIAATFVQNYSSRNYKDTVIKKMVWSKSAEKWLISQEEVVE